MRAQDLLNVSGKVAVRSSVHAVPVYERFGFVIAGPRVDEPGLTYVPMEFDRQDALKSALQGEK